MTRRRLPEVTLRLLEHQEPRLFRQLCAVFKRERAGRMMLEYVRRETRDAR